jgi:hypothetical protein
VGHGIQLGPLDRLDRHADVGRGRQQLVELLHVRPVGDQHHLEPPPAGEQRGVDRLAAFEEFHGGSMRRRPVVPAQWQSANASSMVAKMAPAARRAFRLNKRTATIAVGKWYELIGLDDARNPTTANGPESAATANDAASGTACAGHK